MKGKILALSMIALGIISLFTEACGLAFILIPIGFGGFIDEMMDDHV